MFTLKILKDGQDKRYRAVDIGKIRASDIPGIKDDDIWEYNDLFSEVISGHNSAIEYLVSPTLTRIEGVTLFYDRVCRFIYCLELIDKTGENIVFNNLDYKVIRALIAYAAGRGIRAAYNPCRLWLFALAAGMKFIRDAVKVIIVNTFAIVSSRFFFKIPHEAESDYAFYSFCDYRSYQEGGHRDEYFDPLLKWLAAKGKRIMVFNQIMHHNKINVILRHYFDISGTRAPYRNTVNYRYLTFKDLFLSLVYGISKRPKIADGMLFKGHDISALARLSLREDFYGLGWIKAYLDYFFAKDILRRFSIGRIFYPFENHPWEKAFISARNEMSSPVKLTAFQHSSVSYKLLQYFPGRHEKGAAFMPDKIFTGGRILKDTMEARGHFAPGIVEEGCGLRYQHLFRGQPFNGRTGSAKKLAYAFSFDFKNYETILSHLMRIFDSSEYTVYLKFHPDFVRNIDFRHMLPENFIDARDVPWQDIFKEIDILLYDDNTLCIEALKHNITVGYFALNGQMYNTDRLFGYKRNKIVVNSVEGFKDYLNIYYNRDPAKRAAETKETEDYNRGYIDDYFSEITEERLARFL